MSGLRGAAGRVVADPGGVGDGDRAPPGFTAENLRDLVSELRKRLEPDRPRGEASRLLETVPGIGYRPVACPGTGPAGPGTVGG